MAVKTAKKKEASWDEMPTTRSAENQWSDTVNEVFHKYTQLRLRRDGWRNIFWLLSKYLFMRPVWWGDTGVPWRTPMLSVNNVYDDTSVDAAYTCAMALGGALWPNTAESFNVVLKAPPNTTSAAVAEFQSQEVADYLQEVTKKVHHVMDHPKAGFLLAFGEHLVEQVVYGTSGIYPEEQEDDDECPVNYKAISIETAVFDEGRNKFIDTVMMEYAYTAKEVVDTYGYDNCSDRTQGLYRSEMYSTYVKVVHAIYPRSRAKNTKYKPGNEKLLKPWASVHFEYDSKHLLLEDGLDEFSVFTTRFTKRPNELYGRSLGMNALPSVKELNLLRKSYGSAILKRSDPPLGFYHDMIAGGGQANIGAGARVPLYATGRLPQGQSPIMQLYEIPDPTMAGQRCEMLIEVIQNKFLIDKLLDFANKTRMTAEETRERVGFRAQSLGMVFSRQLYETLDPVAMHTTKILWNRKQLGLHPTKDRMLIRKMTNQGLKPLIMPKIVANLADQGIFPFKAHWISPAAQAMRRAALDGLQQFTEYGIQLAEAGHPEAMDNMDVDIAMREAQHLFGAPPKVLRGKDAMLRQRRVRNQSGAMQQQLNQGEQKATIAQKSATAAKNYAMAGQQPGMNGNNGGLNGGGQEEQGPGI